MKRKAKRWAAFLLVLACLLSGCADIRRSGGAFFSQGGGAAEERLRTQGLQEAMRRTAERLYQDHPRPVWGSVGGEWMIVGLARSGFELPEEYLAGYCKSVEQAVRDGLLELGPPTGYARTALALAAISRDPTEVAGTDLLRPLKNFAQVREQGLMGVIWAVIALDCGAGEGDIPDRQPYLDELLSQELAGGGWSLRGEGAADPDVTSMALQALAGYRDQPEVERAVKRALDALETAQGPAGDFSGGGTESMAQLVVALCALGLSPEEERFCRQGDTLLDRLLACQLEDGSFPHLKDGEADPIATEQTLYALAAAWRFAKGESSLYLMMAEE